MNLSTHWSDAAGPCIQTIRGPGGTSVSTEARSRPAIPMLDLQAEVDELWDEINQAIQRVLRSGQFVLGPEVAAL